LFFLTIVLFNFEIYFHDWKAIAMTAEYFQLLALALFSRWMAKEYEQ